jgi:ribosomal-protein-alanine N-acetyltransferase
MDGMKIEIVKMAEKDVEEVHDIELKVFADPWSKQAFMADLKNDFAYPVVARFENKIAGYASLYQAADEMQIGNIAVAPDFHQRGIGTKLLEYIIQLAHENHKSLVVLEVRQSNTAATNLYKKFGFKVAGRRKYYYHKPVEDALIMIRGVE